MLDLEHFFKVNNMIDFLRRTAVAEYWENNREDDIINQLSPRQINYLATIERNQPCSLQTIIQYTNLSSSAASAAIDKLVRDGIAERVRNQENRREVIITLTPAIQQHLDKIKIAFQKKLAKMLSGCSPEEAEIINSAGRILSSHIKKQDDRQ